MADAQALPCLVIRALHAGEDAGEVTTWPSATVPSSVSAAIELSAALAQHVLDAEQRMVGDVEAEHLALEREQVGLVPLARRDRRRRPSMPDRRRRRRRTPPNRSNWPIASLRLVVDERVDGVGVHREQALAGVAERVERARLDQRLDRLLLQATGVDLAQEVVEVGEARPSPCGSRTIDVDHVGADVADRGEAEADVGADRG